VRPCQAFSIIVKMSVSRRRLR